MGSILNMFLVALVFAQGLSMAYAAPQFIQPGPPLPRISRSIHLGSPDPPPPPAPPFIPLPPPPPPPPPRIPGSIPCSCEQGLPAPGGVPGGVPPLPEAVPPPGSGVVPPLPLIPLSG